MEIVERLEHGAHGVAVGDLAVRGGQGGIEVVPAQPVHPQPLGLEPEVALEEGRVLARDVQQHLDRPVRDVVVEVAHGDGGGVAAQPHLLVVPVAHPGGVDLAQDVGFFRVDAVELLVGRGPQVGVGREGVAHQLVAGELLDLAVDLQIELQAVRQHREQGVHGVDAVLVLDVDDLLVFLVERIGLEAPQVLEVVPVVGVLGLAGQQAPSLVVGKAAPPEGEEDLAVGGLGGGLLHAVAEGQGLLAAGVGVEPERGVARDRPACGG